MLDGVVQGFLCDAEECLLHIRGEFDLLVYYHFRIYANPSLNGIQALLLSSHKPLFLQG